MLCQLPLFDSALTEKIVAVLPRMKCPHRIEPHQIQGLDFIHIFPVIQVWSFYSFLKHHRRLCPWERERGHLSTKIRMTNKCWVCANLIFRCRIVCWYAKALKTQQISHLTNEVRASNIIFLIVLFIFILIIWFDPNAANRSSKGPSSSKCSFVGLMVWRDEKLQCIWSEIFHNLL